jgi:hypothetical protein
MVCLFARIGVALGRMVNHVYTQNRRLWVRLREKAASGHSMSYGHNFEEYLNCIVTKRRSRSVHRAGRCFIGELRDGVRDPAPDSLTLAIASSCKRISASRTLRPGLVAVTLEQ